MNGLTPVEVQYLTPAELDAAIAASSVAYLPLGTIEFHGPHLPVGLDALTALGICVGAARLGGGIVLPPLFQGTGGGHSDYPWTIMMASDAGIRSSLLQTLRRLEQFGVRRAVLFSGHFPDEQLAMIDGIAADWRGEGMEVVATGINRCPTSPVPPDHAGVFEASLLHALRPDLVHIDRLPALAANPDPGGDPMSVARHDPGHPLWGVFGPDPRGVDLAVGETVRGALVSWLAEFAVTGSGVR